MNKEIRKLSQSFRCAFRGIRQCVRTERNLRIHICAAGYVTVFAVMGRLGGYDGAVRDAKDIAAGAVFICALFSVLVGAIFFLRAESVHYILTFLRDKLWVAGVIALSVPVSVAFIFDLRGKL